MEITNNQVNLVTMEGVSPTRDFVVSEGNNKVEVSSSSSATDEGEKVEEKQQQAGNLHAAVSQMNDYVQNLQRDLQFTIDEVTGKNVVTIVDSKSKEVIRQLPSEEALILARRLAENKEENVLLISTQV